MPDTSIEAKSRQAALKKLKEARQEQIAAAIRQMKVQRQAVKAIKEHLHEAELTVPEIAAATGLPVAEVLWHVATMKKYGEVLEGAKDGSYYRYKLIQPAAADTETAPDA
jgi:predicted transcriptional regulator